MPQAVPVRDPVEDARQLIAEMQTADNHTLHITRPEHGDRGRHRSLPIWRRHHLVSDGFDLRHTGRDRGDLVLRPVEDANPGNTDWNRVRGQTLLELTESTEIIAALTKDPTPLGTHSTEALTDALDRRDNRVRDQNQFTQSRPLKRP
jgi:hypothetical protein